MRVGWTGQTNKRDTEDVIYIYNVPNMITFLIREYWLQVLTDSQSTFPLHGYVAAKFAPSDMTKYTTAHLCRRNTTHYDISIRSQYVEWLAEKLYHRSLCFADLCYFEDLLKVLSCPSSWGLLFHVQVESQITFAPDCSSKEMRKKDLHCCKL